MPGISHQNDPNYKSLADLLHGSLLLHQNQITVSQWLQLFAVASDSDASATFRWTIGNPGLCIESYHGDIPGLTIEVRTWIDRVVAESSRRAPGFIEDFLQTRTSTTTPALFLNNPRLLLAIVDWSPACIAIVLTRAPNRPEWNAGNRHRIHQLLAYVRDSVSVHKMLDRNRYIAGLARELLDKSPRGILVLSEDRVIRMANTRAAAILADNDGLSERDGKLMIHCQAVDERVNTYLGKLGVMNNEGLPEMDWNMVAKKRSGGAPYQLILGHLKLGDWNIESRHSDKVAVMHLHDPDRTIGVHPEQLSDFYGFTKAQARLAAKLFHGYTINEAADALHISVNTARTHMRGIYARTGVRTQAELLGLLSSGLTSYGESVENS